ncbi:MAG: ABC transporter substrate-binding protein [Phenylobacterium sp.]|nr:MAG: ABC transporter substrate-binding protein [Phenylobacterium sp.]
MKIRRILAIVIAAVALATAAIFFANHVPAPSTPNSLTVAIAPYQDLAMLVNAHSQGFDKKEGISVHLVTMPWEDILPSVASGGSTVDVGFGSYVEYLTKYAKLNANNPDPVVFIEPLYVYRGGGFVALSSNIAPFTKADLSNAVALQRLKQYKIGAQKQSLYDMMLYSVARTGSIEPAQLRVYDSPMNDGLLALENGSLDLAAAGLPQITEATKRGGHLVISMDDAGFADITGFICKRSTLQKKRPQLESLVRVWFKSVDYVYTDMRANSHDSLAYLAQTAATKYTYEQYVAALAQEYLPRNASELESSVLSSDGKYSYGRIGKTVNAYLVGTRLTNAPAPLPEPMLK